MIRPGRVESGSRTTARSRSLRPRRYASSSMREATSRPPRPKTRAAPRATAPINAR